MFDFHIVPYNSIGLGFELACVDLPDLDLDYISLKIIFWDKCFYVRFGKNIKET